MSDKKEEKKLLAIESKDLVIRESLEKKQRFYSNADHYISDRQKLLELHDLENIKTKLTPEQEKRKKEVREEIATMYGLENGVWAANLSYGQYYPTLAEMRRKIVKDYDCKNSLELMLADRIVANYWRLMRNDTLLNHYMEKKDGSFEFSQLKINAVREFNRGLERAGRQLNADIILLKELKQPKLNIKVTTENAFIAQNQQVNAGKTNNEIIEPK